MKVAIKMNRVYFDPDTGVAEFSILDPDMEKDIKIKLKVNQMTVIDVKKEWVEIGDSNA